LLSVPCTLTTGALMAGAAKPNLARLQNAPTSTLKTNGLGIVIGLPHHLTAAILPLQLGTALAIETLEGGLCAVGMAGAT